jgi:hypothetical protein
MSGNDIISQLIHTLFTNVLNIMYRHSQKGNNAPKQNIVCLFVAFYVRMKRLKGHNEGQLHNFLVFARSNFMYFFPKYRTRKLHLCSIIPRLHEKLFLWFTTFLVNCHINHTRFERGGRTIWHSMCVLIFSTNSFSRFFN